MKVKNMDKYFSFQVLRRGYDYYKKGKVKEIVKSKDGFIAKVSGSEEYRVIIKDDNNKYDMICSCPYAEDYNCKHMAAVLYCLKNDNIPIKENNIDIEQKEITTFKKFKKEYKKEYYKLFHGRYYLHEDEIDDYIDLLNNFIKEGTKYIDNNIELAYEIFEFFLMEIDSADIYEYGENETIFENLFSLYKKIFNEEKIFIKFLAFIGTIYTIDTEQYYFSNKEQILDLFYKNIENKWQANLSIILLNKLYRDKRVTEYMKDDLKTKAIYLTYDYIDKDEAISIAERNLNISEVCDFLLNVYKNSQDKKIDILIKMININRRYSNERYYNELLSIYKKKNKKKYMELLNEKFNEYKDTKTYHEIKSNYTKNEWQKIREKYLDKLKNDKNYINVCIEEEYYDKAIENLKNKHIEEINEYLKLLVHHRYKEIKELYKNKLIAEIDKSSCRKHYQDILCNFNNMLKILHGKDEIKDIIKYIRENYKNRKALQEEIDFYEDTYL